MKTRILSSFIVIGVLFAVAFLYNTLFLNFAVCMIIFMAVHELYSALGVTKIRLFTMCNFVLAGLLPFYSYTNTEIVNFLPILGYILVVLFFFAAIKHHPTAQVEQFGFAFFVSGCVSLAMTCFVLMRDEFGVVIGMFATTVVFVAAFISDTGAYFVGVMFGKTPFFQHVSPKKTWEGFWGGLVSAFLALLLSGYIFTQIGIMFDMWVIEVDYLFLAAVSPLLTIVGVLGDLSASVIKRRYDVKDFGSVLPGHGGILDRFDSILMIAPCVYLLFKHFSPVIVL